MKGRKYILTLIIVILIIPHFAFASWWNPTTWKFFSFFHKNEPSQSQIAEKNYEDKISELQKQIEELKNKSTEVMPVSTPVVSLADEVKAQVAKEIKIQVAQNALNNKEKTLSEQIGVSKDKLSACMKGTDVGALQAKIQLSVENAMKGVPPELRGTPYAIIIGSNNVKEEIRGAQPEDAVKKIIDEVKNGKVTTAYLGEVSAIEAGDHLMGSANATIKIVEYSDLECPYCKVFHATLKKIVNESKGEISWTYRHWPIHPNSFEKLIAAECVATLKGNDAFWKYVDLLFGMINTGIPSVSDQL